MSSLDFDQTKVIDKLKRIRPDLRPAFAAACAERLHPAYAVYQLVSRWGDAGLFRKVLDLVWLRLSDPHIEAGDVASDIAAIRAATPGDRGGPTAIERGLARGAGLALISARLCSQTHESDEALRAARHVFEAFLTYRTDAWLCSGTAGPIDVRLSEAIQQELTRQQRDLDELTSIGDRSQGEIVAAIQTFHIRAIDESCKVMEQFEGSDTAIANTATSNETVHDLQWPSDWLDDDRRFYLIDRIVRALVVQYDRRGISTRLQALPPPLRAIGAAACAERLFPLYENFCKRSGLGNVEKARTLLDQIWERFPVMPAGQLDSRTRYKRLKEAESISILGLERAGLEGMAAAQDAAMAIFLTFVRLEDQTVEDAALAGETGYRAALRFAVADFVDEADGMADMMRLIGGHPAPRTELEHQLRDLDELGQLGKDTDSWKEGVVRIGKRAIQEGRAHAGGASRPT